MESRLAALQLLADAAPVYLAHCDASARYMCVNRGYAERFGLTADQVIGKRIAEVVGETAYESFRERVEAALRGETIEFEAEVPYARGGTRWMQVSYVPVTDKSGTVEGLIAAITDVSQRKKIEASLREADQVRRLAFQAAELGLWLYDVKADQFTFDQRAQIHFGLDASVADPKTLLGKAHPEDSPRLRAAFQAALDPLRKSGVAREFRVSDGSGGERWLRIYGDVHFENTAAAEHAAYATGTSQDITARKQAEQAARVAAARNAFLLGLEERLRTATSGREAVTAGCEALGREMGAALCVVAEVEPDGEHVIVQSEWRATDTPPALGRRRVAGFGPARLPALLAGKVVVVNDAHAKYRGRRSLCRFRNTFFPGCAVGARETGTRGAVGGAERFAPVDAGGSVARARSRRSRLERG
ncbi:MAG: PAS domain S-box protein [Acidobacteriia bacterium]|nr:PAS domain S-box protein [Terriglobia bacterium]